MPREKSRFLTFILVFHCFEFFFCLKAESSLFSLLHLEPTLLFYHQAFPISLEEISFLHFFFHSYSKLEAQKPEIWDYNTKEPCFKFFLNSLFACCSPHKHTYKHTSKPTNEFLFYHLLSCALLLSARFYSEKRDIHHICRVQIYVTTRAFRCYSCLYIFDTVFSSFCLSRIE